MTLLLKDPRATLDYRADWGSHYLDGEAIAESQWEVSPAEQGGLEIMESSHDYLVASVHVSGGVPGNVYQLANRIRTTTGSSDCRSIAIRVEKR